MGLFSKKYLGNLLRQDQVGTHVEGGGVAPVSPGLGKPWSGDMVASPFRGVDWSDMSGQSVLLDPSRVPSLHVPHEGVGVTPDQTSRDSNAAEKRRGTGPR